MELAESAVTKTKAKETFKGATRPSAKCQPWNTACLCVCATASRGYSWNALARLARHSLSTLSSHI
eukprot:scaffold24274_cov146-Isochrysis_galbana.AAC.8